MTNTKRNSKNPENEMIKEIQNIRGINAGRQKKWRKLEQ